MKTTGKNCCRPIRYRLLALFFSVAFSLGSGTLHADSEKAGGTLKVKGELPKEVLHNLTASVGLEHYACHPDAGQRALIYRQTSKQASNALAAFGYFEADIQQALDQPDDKHCFTLTLAVTPGQPVTIASIDIVINGAAKNDSAFQDLIDNPGIDIGERLRQDRYDSLKNKLHQLLIDHGYVDGKLTRHRLEIDRKHHSAHLVFHIDSGERYRLGDIHLGGTPLLDHELLRRYLTIAPGQPLDNAKLLQAQQIFQSTDYFTVVSIQRGEADKIRHTIDITFDFQPRKQWALFSGIGISTDTGPRLRLGAENRRINDKGHKARAETNLSTVERGVGGNYRIPLNDPARESLDFYTSYLSKETDTSESRQLRTGADYIVQHPSGWVTTLSLEFLKEKYQIADQDAHAHFVMPGFQVSRSRGKGIRPANGWRFSAKVRGGHDQLLSSSSFVQYEISGKAIVTLPWIGGRLLTRSKLGITEVSSVTRLPASLRYFAGGDSSVRGFGFEKLGPKDKNGDVIGGRHLLVGSIEYDRLITSNWAWAIFTDMGNAFNDFQDYKMEHSAGAGIRWLSPLGPIRVDIARGLQTGQTWRLHLSMGPDL